MVLFIKKKELLTDHQPDCSKYYKKASVYLNFPSAIAGQCYNSKIPLNPK